MGGGDADATANDDDMLMNVFVEAQVSLVSNCRRLVRCAIVSQALVCCSCSYLLCSPPCRILLNTLDTERVRMEKAWRSHPCSGKGTRSTTRYVWWDRMGRMRSRVIFRTCRVTQLLLTTGTSAGHCAFILHSSSS